MHAYLVMSTALLVAVCLCNAFILLFFYFTFDFSIFIYTNVFCFHALFLDF